MKQIKQIIKKEGSITIARFMEAAMYDSEHGYYIHSSPIGKYGDFITAPEISQLFGEMIGIYCADKWINMGQPKKFNLVELGPGKATLMIDLLRATKHISGFHEACQIHLVDTNDYLIEFQKEVLKPYKVTWHKDIYSLPIDDPLIIIANEFFDCLPVNQYILKNNIWHERSVVMNQAQEFEYIETDISKELSETLKDTHPNVKENDIIEICYSARQIVKHIAECLQKASGYLLAIDYGYDIDPLSRKSYESTIQAIKNHKFHSIFSDIGKADITAHVDFDSLRKIGVDNSCQASAPITQRDFLQGLGIHIRAEMIKKNASLEQQRIIDSGLERLTHPKQMGELFKVLEVHSLKI
jgi:NADH dehydrogenase [ubiquinone] 1 alpha subcomplex assembly factor 7